MSTATISSIPVLLPWFGPDAEARQATSSMRLPEVAAEIEAKVAALQASVSDRELVLAKGIATHFTRTEVNQHLENPVDAGYMLIRMFEEGPRSTASRKVHRAIGAVGRHQRGKPLSNTSPATAGEVTAALQYLAAARKL